MLNPLVSVIVISYNQFRLIFDCIDSILTQDYPNLELIISDDASYDFEREEVCKYIEKNKGENLVRYVVTRNEKNLGIVKNNNTAAKYAQGEFFKFIAADDRLYDETSISSVMPYFIDGANILFTRGRFCSPDGEERNINIPDDNAYDSLNLASANGNIFYLLTTLPYCSIFAPGVFWRTSFFVEKGGYDEENYVYTEDWPMWVRLALDGERFVFLDIITIWYREGGISAIEVIEGLPSAIRKAQIEECVFLLKQTALPLVYGKLGRGTALRCWYSYKCLELRSIIAFQWYQLGWMQKLEVKLRYLPFSIYLKLLSSWKHKGRMVFKYELKLALLLLLLMAFPQPWYEPVFPIFSFILVILTMVILIKLLINAVLFTFGLRMSIAAILKRGK